MEFQRAKHCTFSSDGTIKYIGFGKAQLMGIEPIEDGTYFKVEIISCEPKGSIGIGIARADNPEERYPGWDEGSIGYHSDDGGLFDEGYAVAKSKECACKAGDTITCSIEKKKSTFTVSFLKNGKTVYCHCIKPSKAEKPLYPLISMLTVGDAITVSDLLKEVKEAKTLSMGAFERHMDRMQFQRFDNCILVSNGIIQCSGGKKAQIMGSKPVEDGSLFTVEIISCGPNGSIGIGIAPAGISMKRFPGWDEGSIGYHSDDGSLFHSGCAASKVEQYVCGNGDRLGCSIEKHKTAFTIGFFKNGKKIYSQELSPDMSHQPLYPLVSILAVGDSMKIFSASPPAEIEYFGEQFKADIQLCAGVSNFEEEIVYPSTRQELGGSRLRSGVPQKDDNKPCAYNSICTRFKAHLKIPAAYMDSRHDLCYCDNCETTRGDGLYYKRGDPPQLYATPSGWCRFGLRIPPKAEEQDIFKKWHVGYHGTAADNLIKILRSGDLLMPGDHTLDGGVLKPPSGHFDEKMKPTGFDIQQVFISPTIRYAGMNVYAKPQRWIDPNTRIAYTAKVALQLRIKPSSYQVGKETVLPRGLDVKIDPKFKNAEVEWSTKRRGATIVTGLLLNVDEC